MKRLDCRVTGSFFCLSVMRLARADGPEGDRQMLSMDGVREVWLRVE